MLADLLLLRLTALRAHAQEALTCVSQLWRAHQQILDNLQGAEDLPRKSMWVLSCKRRLMVHSHPAQVTSLSILDLICASCDIGQHLVGFHM
jgi:hypothetical protein